jgi:hypothetical protein
VIIVCHSIVLVNVTDISGSVPADGQMLRLRHAHETLGNLVLLVVSC